MSRHRVNLRIWLWVEFGPRSMYGECSVKVSTSATFQFRYILLIKSEPRKLSKQPRKGPLHVCFRHHLDSKGRKKLTNKVHLSKSRHPWRLYKCSDTIFTEMNTFCSFTEEIQAVFISLQKTNIWENSSNCGKVKVYLSWLSLKKNVMFLIKTLITQVTIMNCNLNSRWVIWRKLFPG